MKLVWKIVFHFILEIFHSILATFIFHTKISIPFSISYHALVVNSILLLLLYHFTPTVVARLKIRKRLIWKNCFRFRILFNTFASASNLFYQSASASTGLVAMGSSLRPALANTFCCLPCSSLRCITAIWMTLSSIQQRRWEWAFLTHLPQLASLFSSVYFWKRT